ncbi:hypothetical protein GYMLUDRAFT_43420 [Collybiopsis luxurians FD-317 M1]|uniref:BTB domain-containing protein n=1 Tax=Collybiopsis luxurians FD-317 M1 TaxID=944289 RepID=A0A0D0BAQ6_9AGAR|nr:hypothetical protein GYMLUDRAFT_43420 [Collybiopsis luxurians FD-317 M1]
MRDLTSTPYIGDVQQTIAAQDAEWTAQNNTLPIQSPNSTVTSDSRISTVAATPVLSPTSTDSSTLRFTQPHSDAPVTTPSHPSSTLPLISPLIHPALPLAREYNTPSPGITSAISDSLSQLPQSLRNGLASPTIPMRPSSLPRSFRRTQYHPESDESSEASYVPDRRTPRVRWDLPEVPPVSAPPSTAPAHPGLITPLWTSTPPGLSAFPLVAPNTAAPTPPWYHTPHPLPLFPHLPSHGMNRPFQTHSDLQGGGVSVNSSPAPHHRPIPELTPGAPYMESHPLPTNLGAENLRHTFGQPQYGPQGVYTYSEQIHGRFFLQDGNIDFRVNNVLFRVHRHFFFPNAKALLIMGPMLPSVIDLTAFGFSPSDFALLLSIIYPRTFGTYEIHGVDGWSTVLKVATALNMRDIRNLAIKQLAEIAPPADRIMMAKKYHVQSWMIPAFKELCASTEPISEEEGHKLGVEGLIKLAQMKHELQKNIGNYLDSGRVDQMVRGLIDSEM